MKIFILAGGFGTRLQSIINDVPKPMAPILNTPFLDYQIDEIRKYFPNTIIYLLTHYKSNIIEEYYKNNSLIKIVKEDEPLGTGGSIKNTIKILNLKNNSQLLILNGDTYIKPNLQNMINNSFHDISILSSFQEDCSRYGTLEIKDDLIINFNEKSQNCVNNFINAGCYYFKDLTFFINIKNSIFAIEDEFKNYLDNYGKISTYKYKNIFIDIGIPDDYKKMIEYIGEAKSE